MEPWGTPGLICVSEADPLTVVISSKIVSTTNSV